MSEIVSPLLEWLNANPEWAGFVTFLISALESVAIIGTIIPGSITMTAIGALAGAGIIPLGGTILWAMLGAIVGDGVSYWMGYYFKDRLRKAWPFKQNPAILSKGETFVHRYGIMSVFIGRFVGPVRALVPLVAGMLGMKPIQFSLANITSAIGWAPAYMLPGILLGAASLELPPEIALHVILVLFLILLFIGLCLWVGYKTLMLISYQTEQWLVRVWNSLKRSRYFHLTTVLLKHHDPKQHHGQLILAFYFFVTSILFCLLVAYVKFTDASNIGMNDTLYHFFRGIRSPRFDDAMLYLTLLGQKQVILTVIGTLFLWLMLIKRTRAAIHLLALGVLTAGSIFILKHVIASPRPFGILNSPETFSMPSGHTTLSAAIYLGIAFLIATNMQKKNRWLIYTPFTLLAFLVAISRLYLGAHWFTDVLSAWFLSASLLMLIILSFNREHEQRLPLSGLLLIPFATLAATFSIFSYTHFAKLSHDYTQVDAPTQNISLNDWWKEMNVLPTSRVSLFGFASQNINIQWAGTLDHIRDYLVKMGWNQPPARDWISTLHRISDIDSGEYLPMVSPQYLDKKPALILAKRVEHGKKLLVLRLWDSQDVFNQTKIPLFVGTLGVVPRSYNWLFRKHYDVESDPALIFKHQIHDQDLVWKIITLPTEVHHQLQYQKILFVKPATLN